MSDGKNPSIHQEEIGVTLVDECPSLTIGGKTAVVFSVIFFLCTLALLSLLIRKVRQKSKTRLQGFRNQGHEEEKGDENSNGLSIDSRSFRETLRDDGINQTLGSLQISPPQLKVHN